jgi:hypothetical protein
MKRSIILTLTVLAVFISLTAAMMDENGKAGYTGSPGEVTCNTTNCHNSYALNSGGGSVSATCTMVNWKYEPLTTYTIQVKVAKSGVHLFGVGVEILDASNNNAGTITVTDAVHTQIKTRTVSGVARRNLVHKLNGGAGTDSVIFSFNWTSPDTTTGPITMYYAGNATNANGNESGDYIYTGSQAITPSTGNKVAEIVTVDGFSVFPNPVNKNFTIHYSLNKSENVNVKLYDLHGALVSVLLNEDRQSGENNDYVALPAACTTGVYLLSIESPSGRVSKKLIVN